MAPGRVSAHTWDTTSLWHRLLSLDGHWAEDPISAIKGQPAGGCRLISAIGDPHGLQACLGGSAGAHLARHKHLFRCLRRREVSLLVKARQDLLGLSRARLKG